MLRFRDLRIKHKLSVVILLTSTVSLTLAFVSLVVYEMASYRSERTKSLTILADVLAGNSTAAISFNDDEAASKVLSALEAEPNLLRAALYGEDDTILASFLRDGGGPAVPDTAPELGETHSDIGELSVARPVNLGGKQIGVIFIVSDTSHTWTRLKRYAQISALVFFVCLLAATGISSLLQRLVSVPIEDLANSAKMVTETRDYTVRARKRGEDELGLLTDAFNAMLTTIEERQHALQNAHDSLELRVKKRTAQLQNANLELERSEETLRLAVEGGRVGTWHWGITSGDLFWSTRCREIFDIPDGEEVTYDLFLNSLHPDDRESTDRELAKALETKGDFTAEYRCIWKDGSVRWIEANGHGLYDQDGVATMMQGVVIDITERKDAEAELKNYADELERSNRELKDFAYVASHDLKEPLRVVSSYCDLLSRRLAGKLDEKEERYIGHITSAAGRMRQLISDLLDYSRVGTKAESLQPTDLKDPLEEALNNLKVSIAGSDAEIECTGPLPTVLADFGQMTQLFQNMIGNAIKFCAANPRVEISSRRSPSNPSRWEIQISDNGPGIEPEFQEQIFKIFERLDSNRDIEGTGIGLAICRRIMERHGGAIRIHSKPGEGAQFIFDVMGV